MWGERSRTAAHLNAAGNGLLRGAEYVVVGSLMPVAGCAGVATRARHGLHVVGAVVVDAHAVLGARADGRRDGAHRVGVDIGALALSWALSRRQVRRLLRRWGWLRRLSQAAAERPAERDAERPAESAAKGPALRMARLRRLGSEAGEAERERCGHEAR